MVAFPPQPLLAITINWPDKEALTWLERLEIPVIENLAAAVDCPPIRKSTVELLGTIAPFDTRKGESLLPDPNLVIVD